ncbi:MAG: hypothetical protein HON43_06305 [Alphaproteobacteria bacterium]|jgi:hypothetical protein|nr:hypothetical protein [Alphaproteobacteria bacterium]MBT5389118.1 hypothetical protein [Alphaproteobacteria bacterium]
MYLTIKLSLVIVCVSLLIEKLSRRKSFFAFLPTVIRRFILIFLINYLSLINFSTTPLVAGFDELESVSEKRVKSHSVHWDRMDFYIFDAKNPGKFREQRDTAYNFWCKNWEDTYKDLGVTDSKLYSDTYMRSKVMALFDGSQAVALHLMYELDLASQCDLKHSSLEFYPEEILSMYETQSLNNVLLIGQATVHPDWRTKKIGVSLGGDLLFSLGTKILKSSSADGIIGVIRADIPYYHGSVFRCGAVKCGTKRIYQIASDYFYIKKQNAFTSEEPDVLELTEKFWKKLKTNEQWNKPAV